MIKSIKKERVEPKRSYPYLGEFHGGKVVLFTGMNKGVSMMGDDIGEYCGSWSEIDATPFLGKIIVQTIIEE